MLRSYKFEKNVFLRKHGVSAASAHRAVLSQLPTGLLRRRNRRSEGVNIRRDFRFVSSGDSNDLMETGREYERRRATIQIGPIRRPSSNFKEEYAVIIDRFGIEYS